VGTARLQRRGGQTGRRGKPGSRTGRLLRRGQVRACRAGAGRARPVQRGDQVHRGGTFRGAARSDGLGPDLAGGVPCRRPPGRADGDPYRVRGPWHQPVHDPVQAHRRRARQLLLLHRLRGAHRRRAGRRGDDGRAPRLRRGPVPRQLPKKRRGADTGPPGHIRSRVRRSRGMAGQAPLRPPLTGARYGSRQRLPREQPGQSEVRTRAAVRLLLLLGRLHEPGGERAAHLLELRAGCHLLCEQRGLDAVEESFEPADQLRLGDA